MILKNPMHRSGLALSGAQRTLEAWAKGEVPPAENDGIVTADELGAFAEAEKLYRDALVVREKADSRSAETAATLHGLGRLLSKTDNLVKAEESLREALAIREQQLPAEALETGYTLYELAKIEARNGNASEAKTLNEGAHKIFQTALGTHHPDAEDARLFAEALGDSIGETIGETVNLLGMRLRNLPSSREGAKKVEPVGRQLFRSGPFNAQEARELSDYAEKLRETGNADDREQALQMQERSLRIRQRVLGPKHPLTLQSLERLGRATLDQRQYDRALVLARKAMFAQTHHLQRIFSFSDEQHRLAFRATVSPFSLFASLPQVPTSDLATAVLRFKGAVLDSLLAERQEADASQDPSLRPLLERAASTREEFQEIAHDLARAGLSAGGLAVSTTISQVASALAPDTLPVEIIRYPHYLDGIRTEDRYGAILLTAAGDPVWIPLGPAAELEKRIDSYTKSARGATDRTTLHRDLRELHDRLWLPVERALQRPYKRVIISPDGALNFVSFATLLTQDDHFLAEKVTISYVASGRDIIVEQAPGSAKTLVICAAPEFGGSPAPARPDSSQPQTRDLMRAIEREAYRELPLPPLDGASREATALRERAAHSRWDVKTFVGNDALESSLRQVRSPRALHIATHGFFLAEDEVPSPKEELSNPMRRSGLALCGAQTTLNLWAKGEKPPAANDGVLTAEEASTLKLNGTRIVTLSACDTGSGETPGRACSAYAAASSKRARKIS